MAIKKIAVFVLLLFVPFYAALPDDILNDPLKISRIEPPAPRLIEPIKDTIDLTGRKTLQFRWENPGAIDVSHCVFRLYEGYDLYDKNLLLNENVPGNIASFEVPVDRFEPGKTYSWSLIRVNLDGRKSGKSFSSFKVVKH